MYSVKSQPTFRRNIFSLSLESQNTPRKKTAWSRQQENSACYLLQAGFLFGLYFGPEVKPTCSSETSADFQRILSVSFFLVALTLEHRTSVKRFVSLQFLKSYTGGRTPWTGDEPVVRPLTTQDNTNRANAEIVGFEPTIPVFQRARAVHALDRTANLISLQRTTRRYIPEDRTLHNHRCENLQLWRMAV
jgi:hypothetical protein